MFETVYKNDDAMISAYKKTGTCQAAASLIGCSWMTISRCLDRHGIKKTGRLHNGPIAGRKKGGSQAKITDYELRKCSQNLTVEEICKKYGIHYATVLARMKRMEISPRFSGDYRNRYKWRADYYNVEYDSSITLDAVFKHDNGICKICGKPIDRSIDALKPTIDHIVPYAKGGGHTWNNVQLAHKRCNCLKRDLIDVNQIKEAVKSEK